jgi:hypothetical protein
LLIYTAASLRTHNHASASGETLEHGLLSIYVSFLLPERPNIFTDIDLSGGYVFFN